MKGEPPRMAMLLQLPVDKIALAHERGLKWIREANAKFELPKVTRTTEPLEVALAVESHRWAWRPESVSVMLIAESHVYTSENDLAITVRQDLLPPEARHAPSEYVRLVYCLGYGENEILSGMPAVENR